MFYGSFVTKFGLSSAVHGLFSSCGSLDHAVGEVSIGASGVGPSRGKKVLEEIMVIWAYRVYTTYNIVQHTTYNKGAWWPIR